MNSLPQIEPSLPIPSRSRWADLVTSMKLGDSVACTISQSSSLRHQARLVGIKVVSRTTAPNQVRVWRVG